MGNTKSGFRGTICYFRVSGAFYFHVVRNVFVSGAHEESAPKPQTGYCVASMRRMTLDRTHPYPIIVLLTLAASNADYILQEERI